MRSLIRNGRLVNAESTCRYSCNVISKAAEYKQQACFSDEDLRLGKVPDLAASSLSAGHPSFTTGTSLANSSKPATSRIATTNGPNSDPRQME